jgi:5-formyltetrahydrofolate cyclo-ligase
MDQAKNLRRKELRRALNGISEVARAAASEQARRLLAVQEFWRAAGSVLFYAPLADEIDLWPLLETALSEGKKVALPWFDTGQGRYFARAVSDPLRQIRRGKFGIREPIEECPVVSINRLDLALVPGVGFDLIGYRLGRGRGYYDRLLNDWPGRACGVAFDEQIVDELPVGPHDRKMNCILTPTRCFEV